MTKLERTAKDRAQNIMRLTREYVDAAHKLEMVQPGMDRAAAAENLRLAVVRLMDYSPDAYWAAYETAIQYTIGL